jgi:N-acyl homoserine lactone hydrolase
VHVEDIRRIPLGTFTRPSQETGGRPQPGTVLGYLVRHEAGVFLFDTGMGSDPGVDSWYQPHRIPLPQALATAGLQVRDVGHVVNCHLHFDHCGGNPMLAGRPIWCQRRELDDAAKPDYTLASLVDFAGAAYELLDGDAEIAPGLWVLATPGHVPGHQSLAVRCADGTVIVAGQAYDTAGEFGLVARSVSSSRSARSSSPAHPGESPTHPTGPAPAPPPWLDRLLALDPARVVFAHDEAVWEAE